jgi:hypothetical protein
MENMESLGWLDLHYLRYFGFNFLTLAFFERRLGFIMTSITLDSLKNVRGKIPLVCNSDWWIFNSWKIPCILTVISAHPKTTLNIYYTSPLDTEIEKHIFR